jgi:peptide/nickel transport system substrate-binding protein
VIRGRAARPLRTRRVLLIVVAGLCTLLAACGGSPGKSSPSGPGPSALTALAGGSVTVAVPQVPTNLNPHTASDDSAVTEMITSLTDPQVFEVGPALLPVLDTDFVLSAEVESVNPQTVVYDLNPSAVWSDGVPIGLQDFLYAWQVQNQELGYRNIQSITSPSTGDSVQVIFKSPYADWADLFDDLLPEHVASVIGWNTGYNKPNSQAFVSGGPYEVTSWIPGSRIVLARNPRWWGTPGKIATIVVDAESGSTNLAELISSRDAGVVYTTSFDQSLLESVSASPETASQTDLGTTMLQLVFNLKSSSEQSADSRQGIALEIDRKQIVSDLVDPLDPAVAEDDDFLATNAQHSYTPDGAAFDTSDPQAATTLLEDAGLRADADGSWTHGGNPVVLDLRWASADPWSQLVAPVIEAELVDAGFEVKADPVAVATLSSSDLTGSRWDLALVPLVSSAYPGKMAQAYSDSTAVTGAGQMSDYSGFDVAQVDNLFQQASEQLAEVRAAPIYQQIDTLLWQAMPAVPLFAEPTLLVVDSGLSGVESDASGPGPMWSADAWARLGVAPDGAGKKS